MESRLSNGPAIDSAAFNQFMGQAEQAPPAAGSKLTAETKARVAAFKGDMFLIADPYEMDRARAALAEYGLAIRWLQCGDIKTNMGDDLQFCPLARKPDAKP